MGKYLELFRGEVGDLTEKTKLENKPYVAYSTKLGKVTYTVVPKEEPIAPISYEAVDLGLPSGLKWANMNVGATSPEDAGMYFQWGDTVGYTKEQVEAGEKVFDWDNYFDVNKESGYDEYGFPISFIKYNTEGGLTLLESEDDAATQNMGSDWRMPTITEIQELINNTTPTFIDLQGNEYSQEEAQNFVISEGNLKGVKFTGSNNNSIFIPAASVCDWDGLSYVGHSGCLWSSSLGEHNSDSDRDLYFNYYGELYDSYGNRYMGASVRGVKA